MNWSSLPQLPCSLPSLIHPCSALSQILGAKNLCPRRCYPSQAEPHRTGLKPAQGHYLAKETVPVRFYRQHHESRHDQYVSVRLMLACRVPASACRQRLSLSGVFQRFRLVGQPAWLSRSEVGEMIRWRICRREAGAGALPVIPIH